MAYWRRFRDKYLHRHVYGCAGACLGASTFGVPVARHIEVNEVACWLLVIRRILRIYWMLGIGRRRWSDTNISRRKVAVDDPFITEEVANSANDGTEGTDTVDSSEGLARYYLVACIINRGTTV